MWFTAVPLFPGPFEQLQTDGFGAVDSHRTRFAPPFNELVEAAYDPLTRQGEVDLDVRSVSIEAV